MKTSLKRIFVAIAFVICLCLFAACKNNNSEKEAVKPLDSSSSIQSSVATTSNTTPKLTTTTTTTTVLTTTTTTTTAATTTTTTTTVTTVSTTTQITTTTTTSDDAMAPYAGLYELGSTDAIFEVSAGEQIYPASLTKLLTACTALDYVSSDVIFTVASELNLVNSGSSLCLISWGHSLTLYDLMSGMLIRSGNDAAYTIAVNVAREVSGNPSMSDYDAVQFFVGLMNQKAEEIGMTSSNFVNPDGWDDENQYTTVEDLSKLASYAIGIGEIKEIVSCQSRYVVFASGQSITWNNTNALLYPDGEYYCDNAIGMKTGSTLNAGKCLISAFDVEGKIYIAIVANCGSEAQRYKSTLQLYDMIFE